MPGVQEYLSTQAAAGRFDSSGRFELRADLAREKLAAFQLKRPSLYVLRLIAAGVAAGAVRIEVRADARESVVRWHGVELSSQQLENPYGDELGLGLVAAERRGRVSLESSGKLEPAAGAETVIRVRHGILSRLLRRPPAEVEEVLAACRFSPVPLWLNGREVTGWRPRPPLFGSYRRGGCGPALEATPKLECLTQETPFSLYVSLRKRNQEVAAPLQVVVDGVTYPTEHVVPGAGRAIAWADHLKLDLSRAGVVDDAALRQVAEHARREAGRLESRAVHRRIPIDSPDLALLYHRWIDKRSRRGELGPALEVATFAAGNYGDVFSRQLRALRFGMDQLRAALVVPDRGEAALDRLVLALEVGEDPHLYLKRALDGERGWEAWMAMAFASLRAGDLHGAVAYRDQLLGTEHPESARLEVVALTELALGNPDRAAPSARRLAECCSLGFTLAALTEAALGRSAQAHAMVRRRLKFTQAEYGPNHPEMAAALNLQALVLRMLDGWDARVASLLECSTGILESTFGPGHRAVSGVREALSKSGPGELILDFRDYFLRSPRCFPFLYSSDF